jgi:hypothetical protein
MISKIDTLGGVDVSLVCSSKSIADFSLGKLRQETSSASSVYKASVLHKFSSANNSHNRHDESRSGRSFYPCAGLPRVSNRESAERVFNMRALQSERRPPGFGTR